MKIVKRPQPPTGITRLVFRLPIRLYRLGLGWLLGRRLLYLVHIGRKSGRPREVVLEVVGRDSGYLVCAGFGPNTDWYRNVLDTPEVTIQVGRHRTRAVAEALPTEEGGDVMALYGAQRPRLARRGLRKLMGIEVDGSTEDFRAAGRTLPFVRFTPLPQPAA
ncbi:nitroreductase family deazaflavin-dependent oxidoreductase [Qaidamihabitans albus]|uniref:nitroreductase family deazaflavin-dependent oxidoreductase n=1 Tax=Qaidamihabitans albus TaxID=2795733 RepID=UPI0018F2425C|nr:nitroreductase family deazaflavin-dependent oxidoreductase [Qaidamihabitans albus]